MRLFRHRSTDPDRPFTMPLAVHIALMLVLAAVLAVALGFGLWWGIGKPSITTGKPWTAKESFDFVKIVLAIIGGTGAVVALVVSYRKQQLGEAAETREDARLFAEDFARATEQLGSSEAPVRSAGMYTLERLGQNTPQQQQTIVNVLCAYLRMPYTPPEAEPAEEHRQENERRKHEREVRLTAQRILATNLRPRKAPRNPASEHWKDPHLDLTGATLLDFDVHECQLATALFNGAQFSGKTRFDGAQFSGKAVFTSAQFSGDAWFTNAQFSGQAWFDRAQFSGQAWFDGAQFGEQAWFDEAQFSGQAVFAGKFSGQAWFDEAQFSGQAVFAGKFSGQALFHETQFSGRTVFAGRFSGDAEFVKAQFSGDAEFDRARFSEDAVFVGAQFSGQAWFDGAQFTGRAVFDGVRVRLDASEDALSNRTWPQGYAVTVPATSGEARLSGREGRWGYLIHAASEESDTHFVPTIDIPGAQ